MKVREGYSWSSPDCAVFSLQKTSTVRLGSDVDQRSDPSCFSSLLWRWVTWRWWGPVADYHSCRRLFRRRRPPWSANLRLSSLWLVQSFCWFSVTLPVFWRTDPCITPRVLSHLSCGFYFNFYWKPASENVIHSQSLSLISWISVTSLVLLASDAVSAQISLQNIHACNEASECRAMKLIITWLFLEWST